MPLGFGGLHLPAIFAIYTAKEEMMYQHVVLIGNLGSDPEMRYTPTGVPVTNFSLAVNRRWTNQEGQPQEKTNWFQVTTWRRQAELVNQYLAKGRRIMISGEIDGARPWTDRDGNQRATIEITARDIKFLDNRSPEAEAAANDAGAQETEGAAAIPF
jgi:single-strand DNA-binding protein